MNVWHIVVFKDGDRQPGDVSLARLGNHRVALIFLCNDEIDVHGGENVEKALNLLKKGKLIHELREMICERCGNFKTPSGTGGYFACSCSSS